jgi:hypothetical protein
VLRSSGDLSYYADERAYRAAERPRGGLKVASGTQLVRSAAPHLGFSLIFPPTQGGGHGWPSEPVEFKLQGASAEDEAGWVQALTSLLTMRFLVDTAGSAITPFQAPVVFVTDDYFPQTPTSPVDERL